mgnify:CR=1 FL=1
MCGSSPRMRGKPGQRLQHRGAGRLIPAHAGKTRYEGAEPLACAAHPRACGENRHEIACNNAHDGSSPRMRGKPISLPTAPNLRGLIPAHAGKTRLDRPRRYTLWAHPRACGENMFHLSRLTRRPGSSPRMRGKRELREADALVQGLIPAHAGKTPAPHRYPRPDRLIPAHAGKTRATLVLMFERSAHPRACGEN